MKKNLQPKTKPTNNTNDVFSRLYNNNNYPGNAEKVQTKPPSGKLPPGKAPSEKPPPGKPPPGKAPSGKPPPGKPPPGKAPSGKPPPGKPPPGRAPMRKPAPGKPPPGKAPVRKPATSNGKPGTKELSNKDSSSNGTRAPNTVFDRLYKRNEPIPKKKAKRNAENEQENNTETRKKRPLRKSVSFKSSTQRAARKPRISRSRSLSPSDKPFVVLSLTEGVATALPLKKKEETALPFKKEEEEQQQQPEVNAAYYYESDFESDDEEHVENKANVSMSSNQYAMETSHLVDDKASYPQYEQRGYSAMSLSQLSRNEEFWENYPDDYMENLHISNSHDNPHPQERQAAGHDSGRKQLHLLNEREKQKGIFTVKDGRNSQPGKIREVDYDTDNSGVYRAKSEAKETVHEINDSEETSTELPFDARDAEEVKDEEIDVKPYKPRKELNANGLDIMSAIEPSLEVDFDGNGVHSLSDKERDSSPSKKYMTLDVHDAGFLKKERSIDVNVKGDQLREEKVSPGKSKKNIQEESLLKSDVLKSFPGFTPEKKERVEKASLPQQKGDYLSNSDLSSDSGKKSNKTYSLQELTNLLLPSAKKKGVFGYSCKDADGACSSPSETSANERRQRSSKFANHARKIPRKKRSHTSRAHESESSTVTYSPRSITPITEDDDSNPLTSRLSTLSVSNHTMTETDISEMTSREDLGGFLSSGVTIKTSSETTEEFSKQAVPFRLDSYTDARSIDFDFPQVTDEFETTNPKTSRSTLSIDNNSENGSHTINSETTNMSYRSTTSQFDMPPEYFYRNLDESQSTLYEKENFSSNQNTSYKINNKIRSNVLSIPHVL